MTDTTAPRTAAAELHDAIDALETVSVEWAPAHSAPYISKYVVLPIVDIYAQRIEAEAIEPLLALVRAALEVAREDAMSQPKRTASVNALRATYRALPESVRVAANREERPRNLSTESDGGSSDDAIRVAARKP